MSVQACVAQTLYAELCNGELIRCWLTRFTGNTTHMDNVHTPCLLYSLLLGVHLCAGACLQVQMSAEQVWTPVQLGPLQPHASEAVMQLHSHWPLLLVLRRLLVALLNICSAAMLETTTHAQVGAQQGRVWLQAGTHMHVTHLVQMVAQP